MTSCRRCGKDFTPSPRYHHAAIWCSQRCKKDAEVERNRAERVAAWGVKPCGFCGDEFPAKPNAKWCSDVCAQDAATARKRERRRSDPDYRARVYAIIDWRAAQKRAGEKRVTLRFVLDRDAGVCQLCGDAVDTAALWPAPWSPTVDHIVPLKQGGSHSRDNVQLAHARCNRRKGSRLYALEA